MMDFLREAFAASRRRAAVVLLVLLILGLCYTCTGCANRRQRPAPSLATAQAIAREQHAAFTAQQRELDRQAVPIEAARSHSAEARLRAQQIDAKARVILEHW